MIESVTWKEPLGVVGRSGGKTATNEAASLGRVDTTEVGHVQHQYHST